MENNIKPTEKNTLSELLILGITLVPIIYLVFIYGSLPDKIPVHWNFQGEVDRYGGKHMLWIFIGIISLPTYLLMLFLPKFSAKRDSIKLMGKKYFRLRLILQLFMSGIICAIIFAASGVSDIGIEVLLSFCFIAFMILFGNYMGSLRQNHFIGIRTPWTLENEEVWKKTHQLGGRFWVIGGLLGLLLMAFLPTNWVLMIIIGLMVIPLLFAAVYSFILFKRIT